MASRPPHSSIEVPGAGSGAAKDRLETAEPVTRDAWSLQPAGTASWRGGFP